MTDASLQFLLDKRALDELIFTQNVAADRRDWRTYRNCLADRIDFDSTEYTGYGKRQGSGQVTDPDAWVAFLEASAGFDATMHFVVNVVHDVQADRCTSECYVIAQFVLNNEAGDPSFTSGQYHQFDSIRTPDGWKLSKRRLEQVFAQGNPSIFALASEEARRRRPDDPKAANAGNTQSRLENGTGDDSSLRTLSDKQALDELIATQAMALDSGDWVSYRNCFAGIVDFNFASDTDALARDELAVATDPDKWVDNARSLIPGFDATMHVVSNGLHWIDGDRAHSESYVIADHLLNNPGGDREMGGGGVYIYDSIRTPEGWKIETWRLNSLFSHGNASLYAQAMAKVLERSSSARSPLGEVP